MNIFPYLRYSLICFLISTLMINNSIPVFRGIGYGFIILALILVFFTQMHSVKALRFESEFFYIVIPLIAVYLIGVFQNVTLTAIKEFVLLLLTLLLLYVVSRVPIFFGTYQNKVLKVFIPILIIIFYVAYWVGYGINSIDGGYTGVFSTTTFCGMFSAMLLELCLLNYSFDKKKSWIMYSLLLMFIVYETKVRTGYIGAILIVFIFVFINKQENIIRIRKIFKICRIMTYFAIFVFIAIYPVLNSYSFFDDLSMVVFVYTGKILMSGRGEAWIYYMQYIFQNPVLGYGLDYMYSFPHAVNSVHNSYLNILLQVGFLGLAFVFLFINKVFVEMEKTNIKWVFAIEGFSLINLIMSTTEVMLLQGQIVLQLIIWILMGAGLRLARKTD